MISRQMLLAAVCFLASLQLAAANDATRIALTSLCDPAKIATLKSDRAANPRIQKIAYWLEVARQQGRDPKAKMDAVMTQLGWGGTAKGELTAAATLLHGSRDPGHERRLKRWQRVPRGAPSGVNDSMLGLESDNVVVVLGNCS